ncbi:MAG: NAD-dependent epimerase/dehydratase family protein [Chlamydia sp.]
MPSPHRSIFITGIAGFIGFHTALKLRRLGVSVVGVDSFIPYYDLALKEERARLLELEGIAIHRFPVENGEMLKTVLKKERSTHIIHLAAQAGVRYSLENPKSYLKSNIDGFLSILEACRADPSIRTVWASSSSVYGTNTKVPFSEEDVTDHPANLYGATKKSNELMAFSYHHLFQLQLIGLRFFTVYGPWGRPDMAYYSFAEKILRGEPIELYGKEELRRDFTYIDDITDGILSALFSEIPFGVYNLGGSKPESVLYLVECLETFLEAKAQIRFKKRPKGDIEQTYADCAKASRDFSFVAQTSLQEGISSFCRWLLEYKKSKKY